MEYGVYKEQVESDIRALIAGFNSQPILFVGSGFSRRYCNAPDWRGLLEAASESCDRVEHPFAYYEQICENYPAIASKLADTFREWAWSTGKNEFSSTLFEGGNSPEIYFKTKISEIIQNYPFILEDIEDSLKREIEILKKIRPHAIITTNFDQILEEIFDQYKAIIREEFVESSIFTIGEIIKIHGCISEPESLTITTKDYEEFGRKRKYLSAKLLTYMREHPILFIGYSASDENIAAILSDIDEALATPGDTIQNMYFLEWKPDLSDGKFSSEKLVQISENRSVRVKCIQSDEFDWVFDAFSVDAPLQNVNAKVLRTLMARCYHLIRSDIPRAKLEVDFDFIEKKMETNETFAKVFGISSIEDASALNAMYPFSITELGRRLGGKTWHPADKLMKKVMEETGYDIKSSDNQFHRRIRINTSTFGKYSEECLTLLKKVAAGESYSIGNKK